jgi:hypothetical protein
VVLNNYPPTQPRCHSCVELFRCFVMRVWRCKLTPLTCNYFVGLTSEYSLPSQQPEPVYSRVPRKSQESQYIIQNVIEHKTRVMTGKLFLVATHLGMYKRPSQHALFLININHDVSFCPFGSSSCIR